ncbi:hypothetical protein LCGC14_2549120 [marine sediment metagenome]|uniref:Uncharacterized protein n=1 Tax=marine sediment metagenome TaxID=412755 RepID=A0A0F9BB90_9ZZZZ
MKVEELREFLEECDPEAEVRIMFQPTWPFELSISSVRTRDEFEQEEDYEKDWSDVGERQHKGTDVFLVEGRQLCYGSKEAWNDG